MGAAPTTPTCPSALGAGAGCGLSLLPVLRRVLGLDLADTHGAEHGHKDVLRWWRVEGVGVGAEGARACERICARAQLARAFPVVNAPPREHTRRA